MSQAEHIARALGGKRNGQGWLVRCSAHNDASPSLSLRDGKDGKLLVKCFAGCSAHDVLSALQPYLLSVPYSAEQPRSKESNPDTVATARKIWSEVRPANGTLVHTYLQSRSLWLPPEAVVGFHPSLWHSASNLYWPAMVALVQHGQNNTPIGIHRTYLARDGKEKAPVAPQKMMLGQVSGGAVKLAKAEEKLAIAEGVETAISVIRSTGLPTWAALSAGGLETLTLPPPPLATDILICADNDESGRGLRAAYTAAERWHVEGRRVRIITPVKVNTDFNDTLISPSIKKRNI